MTDTHHESHLPIFPLITRIKEVIHTARTTAAYNINTLQVRTNFEIGRLIVEYEQGGSERADYGKQTIPELSKKLTSEFGRGFSRSNLENMRRFYIEYSSSADRISQTLSGKLSGDSPETRIIHDPHRQEREAFSLSWSHYVFLLTIGDRQERRFYEIEADQSHWSLSELKRQFNSGFYERLALSRDEKEIHKLAETGHVIEKPGDMIKDPYVLEFLGLDEREHYSESDLESAIIDRLEKFLLELGKGFLFESRQKRLTFDADHYYVDLVFYNRLLRCYVLIDLKLGKLTHENLGQMQMYVNYYDRYVKLEEEGPTIGIILCKTKNDALINLTLPDESNIYASRYQLYLPSKEELKTKLIEWAREERKRCS